MRFSSDQNQVGLYYESGTYGNPTGTLPKWIGQVTTHEPEENENLIELRHLGTASRNVDSFVAGQQEVGGTLTFRPQDFRFIGLFLGSITNSATASATKLNYSEVNNGQRLNAFTSGTLNPMISFSLEDSKSVGTAGSNFVRTIKGCNVNTLNISIDPGVPVEVEAAYIAQSVAFSSGTPGVLTANTDRPFMWSDCTVQLPGGTTLEAVKTARFIGANGTERSMYVGSGRASDVPAPLNRVYTMNITKDMTAETAKSLYDQYYKGGSAFNMVLDINADLSAPGIGSRHLIATFSGCKITDMTEPSAMEGINEQTFTVRPITASAIEYKSSGVSLPW